MSDGPTRVAVIDIGTNSTRLLAAEVSGGQVHELERHTCVTRLGRGVDLSGQLSTEAIEDVCKAVAGYIALYRELGIERVMAIATSAVRDADNGSAFIAELRERFDLNARVIPGEEEAGLTYLGATAGQPPEVPTLVLDIGGGSTEFIVGQGTTPSFHASLQAGVVRHSERHISADPPSTSDLENLAADVHHLIQDAIANQPDAKAEAGIAVAGTPTSLAAIDLELDPYDSEQVHGHRLSLVSVQKMLSRLASVPLSERIKIPGLHPDRAPTIVAGVVILIEVMRAFGLDEVKVSEHDILYGSALSLANGSG